MIIELFTTWLIIVNILAWFLIHMGVAYFFYKLPFEWFEKNRWFYVTQSWEKDGRFWHSFFLVKKWKDYLPDGAAIFKKGFRKKNISQSSPEFFKLFIVESRRGEMTHWIAMMFAPLFFIWNPPYAGYIMIAYAILANLPCIIAQRYNRPRFEKLLLKFN